MNPLLLSSLPDDVVVEVALFLSPADLLRLYHTTRRFATKKFVATVAKRSGVFVGHQKGLRDLALVPSTTKVVSASDDETLRVWDYVTGETKSIERVGCMPRQIAVTPDGRRCLVSTGQDCYDEGRVQRKTLAVWNLEEGRLERTIDVGHPTDVFDLSPDGEWLACAGWAPGHIRTDDIRTTIRIFRFTTGEFVHDLGRTFTHRVEVKFTTDSQKIVVAGPCVIATVWNVQTKERERKFYDKTYDDYWTGPIAIQTNGKTFVSVASSDIVVVKDMETGARITTTKHPEMWAILDVAFTPDGRRIVTGSTVEGSRDKSTGGKVRVCDAASGEWIKTFCGHEKQVVSVVVEEGGRWCLSASSDGTVRRWDLSKI